MGHTKGPWVTKNAAIFERGEDCRYIAICAEWADGLATKNARRIAACVNVCDGLETDLIEKIVSHGGTLPRRLEAMTNWERSEAEKQRDELRAALEYLRQHKLWANGHAKAVIESALEKVGADRTAPEGHNLNSTTPHVV